MSNRYTQSKSTQAKHNEKLRALLKLPDNKLCADCKKHDPRWASTNLGCFICIRCSGVHRGMGVHISRVRSVDLDTWTPEQIETMERWGNRRVNLYWEANLKPGHIPPEHKMESFIRSKYESKKWAMAGPRPEPEALDGGAPAAAPVPATAPAAVRSATVDLLGGVSFDPLPATNGHAASTTAAPAATQSYAAAPALTQTSSAPTQSNPVPTAAPVSAPPGPKKTTKEDILSLFNSVPAVKAAPAPSSFANASQLDDFFSQVTAVPSAAPTSSFNAAPTSSFNAGAAAPTSTASFTPSEPNIWANPTSTTKKDTESFSDIWR